MLKNHEILGTVLFDGGLSLLIYYQKERSLGSSDLKKGNLQLKSNLTFIKGKFAAGKKEMEG